jgi:putative ABC transport system permease protein
MAASGLAPLVRIAWRNVRKNWRHSLGSMLSIAVGFVAIGLFEGYLSDLEDLQALWYEQRAMFGDLMVERRGASSSEGRQDPVAYLLDRRAQDVVDGFLRDHATEVTGAVRNLFASGLASTGRTGVVFFARGFDVDAGLKMRGPWAWNTLAGRPLHLAGPDAVLVGEALGKLLNCEGPPPERTVYRNGLPIVKERPLTCRQSRVQLTATTASGQLNAVEPDIAGTFDGGLKDLDSRIVHMPLPLAQQLLDTEGVSFYTISLRRSGRAPRLAAELTDAARAQGVDVVAVPWRQHYWGELYRRSMTLLGLYRFLVIVIVVTIAGMSVFTTMLKAVNERVREIGTLRSIGYRRRHIVALFTMESAMLALLSSLVGLAATAVITALINAADVTYSGGIASQPIPLTVSLLASASAFAAAFLSGVAVLAAVFPARRAARLPIPDALGHA